MAQMSLRIFGVAMPLEMSATSPARSLKGKIEDAGAQRDWFQISLKEVSNTKRGPAFCRK
jgi:hypothetical protein